VFQAPGYHHVGRSLSGADPGTANPWGISSAQWSTSMDAADSDLRRVSRKFPRSEDIRFLADSTACAQDLSSCRNFAFFSVSTGLAFTLSIQRWTC
jgi:hypothetical protein